MTTTLTDTTAEAAQGASDHSLDLELVQQFAEKVAGDHAVAANAVLGYLGDRLGLWRALASLPSATSQELADRTGLSERYLREWLSAQAAAGYLAYDSVTRSFSLPPERAAVLADDDSPAAMAGGFEFAAAVWASADRLANAFATGEGIAWSEHDPRLTPAVERFFRPLYANSLIGEWIPAVPGLAERLRQGARVLDVGCGAGTATTMLAQAFPASTFVGIDLDRGSLRRASEAAVRRDVQDRVTFDHAGLQQHRGTGYDVVCFFDALHDMGDPVGELRRAFHVLAADGVVLAVEPAAADHLEDNLHPLGLSWYAASSMVCLPGSLSQPGGAGLGAQAGPARTLQVFAQAGFTARVATTTAYNMVIEGRR